MAMNSLDRLMEVWDGGPRCCQGDGYRAHMRGVALRLAARGMPIERMAARMERDFGLHARFSALAACPGADEDRAGDGGS